jgi:hypothetical protein
MYKAKCNSICGDKSFTAGEEYTKKQIEGMCLEDFELLDPKQVKEAKPKSMTTKSLKVKK